MIYKSQNQLIQVSKLDTCLCCSPCPKWMSVSCHSFFFTSPPRCVSHTTRHIYTQNRSFCTWYFTCASSHHGVFLILLCGASLNLFILLVLASIWFFPDFAHTTTSEHL